MDQPLHEALDLLCSDFEYEWETVDRTVILRPRLWFLAPEERRPKIPGRGLFGSRKRP